MAKHGPVTRAADWPSCVIDAQRPATSRLTARAAPSWRGSSIRSGSWLKPRDCGIGGQRHSTSPATCSSSGQPLTPIVSAKLAQPSDLVAAQHVLADEPARLADADLRRDLEQVRRLEAGDARAQEAQVVDGLAAAFDLAGESERASVPSTAEPSAFFSCVTLTRHSPRGAAAGRSRRGAGSGTRRRASASSISARNRPPRLAGARVVDVADAKHQGRKSSATVALHRRAGEVGEVAVARAVDEGRRADGEAAGLGFDEERVDRAALGLHGADRDGVEQQLGAGVEQHRVGRALERGGVVGLRQDLAEDEMRLVEAVERAHPLEQLVGDAAHDAGGSSPCTLACRPQKLVTPAAVPMPPRKP